MPVCEKEYEEVWAAYDKYYALRLEYGRSLIGRALLPAVIIALIEYRDASKRYEDCWRAHGGVIVVADILGQHNELLASNIEYLQSLV